MSKINTAFSTPLESIIKSGLNNKLPVYLAKGIESSNIIAVTLIGILCLPFSILTYIFFPSLLWYPLTAGLLLATSIVFNHLGTYGLARLIVSLIPISLGAVYNASLSGPEDGPLPSLYLLEMGFALIPLIVYDRREKWFIAFTLSCSVLIIMTFPMSKHWFHSPYDSTLLRNGWLNSLTILLALLTQLGCVLGLLSISQRSENKSEQLRQLAEDEKRMLQAEQAENHKKTEELKVKQVEEKKRQWANEGITTVSKVIRDYEDSEQLYDRVLASIVKYLQANQGSLFIVEGEDTDSASIVLKACYAYGRKKFEEKTLRPGQGLVGQTYMEKKHTYLTDVPQNYVNITSGLGEATPNTVMIMPLITNHRVQGILELASFKLLEIHEIHFLEKLGEILAGQINSKKVVAQTQHLLIQAQEQSEQLKSQEEEMRQNLEELAATQEQSQRQLEENTKLSDQLQSREVVFGYTTILSEADLYGTIIYANDKLCEVSKYAREELIGKGHNIFRHADMPKALFKLFWKTIKGGQVFNGIIKNRAKDGTHYWVDATIVPVKDEHGKTYKYIGARYHITDDYVAEYLYAQQLKKLGIEVESQV